MKTTKILQSLKDLKSYIFSSNIKEIREDNDTFQYSLDGDTWKDASTITNHNDLANRDVAGNHAKLIPETDSTTAVQITKADGTTPMINVDTTNETIGLRGIVQTASDTVSAVRIDGSGATSQQNVAFLRGGSRRWFWGLGAEEVNPSLIAYSDDLASTILKIDATTGNFGVRNLTPTEALDVNGTIISRSGRLEANADNLGYQANLVLRTYLNSSIQSSLTFVSARGSLASPTNSLSGDRLMAMYANGYDGTALSSKARIMVQADGNWSSTNHGTKFSIALTPTNSTTLTDVFTALGNGNVGIGTTTPVEKLDVNGNIKADQGILPIIKPETDSTTAIQITKANGTTPVVTVNTSGERLTFEGFALEVNASDDGRARIVMNCGNANADQCLTTLSKGGQSQWLYGSGTGPAPNFLIYNSLRSSSDFSISNTTGNVQIPAAYYNHQTSGRDLHVTSSGMIGYQSSTKESKKNIDYNLDSSWIYDLKPVSYEYKKQDENGNLLDEADGIYREGLIAEDVNEVRPEMCYKDEDGTLRGVDYKYIIASLLKEVQTQKRRNDDLEKRIQILESK